MARLQKLEGTITRIEPSRNFTDGVYCQVVEFSSSAERREMRKVFFTLKLCSILKLHTSGVFYFWNEHCYAFRGAEESIEDIEGARASYFHRDARLLLLMAVSIVLLPVVVFIAGKKLLWGGSAARMSAFLSR